MRVRDRVRGHGRAALFKYPLLPSMVKRFGVTYGRATAESAAGAQAAGSSKISASSAAPAGRRGRL